MASEVDKELWPVSGALAARQERRHFNGLSDAGLRYHSWMKEAPKLAVPMYLISLDLSPTPLVLGYQAFQRAVVIGSQQEIQNKRGQAVHDMAIKNCECIVD